MSLFCTPLIGVVLVLPNGAVDIGYYAVAHENLPDLQTILDKLVQLLGYASLEIVDGPKEHHYGAPMTVRCPPNGG